MARQAGNGRSIGSVRNPSGGAAVLDRPEHDAPEMHAKDLLQEEIQRLVEASRAGRLSERGRVERFEGNDRTLVEGVNTMLDAILLPIGEGNRVLAQISAGKIDELITQTYSGDHEKMKQAVNNVAVVLQGLQKELGRLTEASKEGQLSERGKPDQFQGAYAGIVKGVNDMLDAILLPIGEGNRILAQISNGRIDELIAQTYKGDHEKMKQAVNNVAAALQNMAKDVSLLVQAMVEGKLAVRADAAKHQGDFRKVIEGFNLTLDNVIKPLNVSAEYVDRISKGDIPPKITAADVGGLPVCARRRGQASGRLQKGHRRLQPDAGQRHQAPERVRRVRGPHQQGRYTAENHRHLPRRLQRNQKQPERLHRCP